jgi:hypothetical protein
MDAANARVPESAGSRSEAFVFTTRDQQPKSFRQVAMRGFGDPGTVTGVAARVDRRTQTAGGVVSTASCTRVRTP